MTFVSAIQRNLSSNLLYNLSHCAFFPTLLLIGFGMSKIDL
jgi:hypothetical protein